jgi:hypothetical protein
MMKSTSQTFIKNRSNPLGMSVKIWSRRWRSGLIRLLERILSGSNISDRLGGDLSQIQHLEEVSNQLIEIKIVSKPEFSKPIEINGISTYQASVARKIGILRDCSVDINSGLIRLQSGFVVDGALPHWQQLLYQGGLTHEYRGLRNPKQLFAGTYFVIPNAKYFFHFVLETLPSYSWALEQHPDCKVLMNSNSPKWQIDVLDNLQISYTLTSLNSVKVEKLVFVTSPRALISSDLDRIKSLRKASPRHPDKIQLYIARGDKDRGDSYLESELIKYFASIGFKTLVPDETPFAEQRELFERAERVVSFHGGALTNIVWCSPGTKVFEILNNPFRTYDYAKVCAQSGLEYFPLNIDSSRIRGKFTPGIPETIPEGFIPNNA